MNDDTAGVGTGSSAPAGLEPVVASPGQGGLLPAITEPTLVGQINARRRAIKAIAGQVDDLKAGAMAEAKFTTSDLKNTGECIANLTLAYRHLEDASMRLGKAIQAADGGVSVYDRDTTVGA